MVLGLNDLPTVLDELYDIRDKWYNLGLRLNVPTEKLESLTSHDQDSCFRQVLVDWLKSGQATWLALCQALSHRTVGQDEQAKKLQAKYTTVRENSQATDHDSQSAGSHSGRVTSASTSESAHQLQPQQNQQSIEGASNSQQKAIASGSAKEGTASTKKRPLDTVHPKTVKKPKSSIKLPDSFVVDDFATRPAADRLCIKCNRVPFNPQRSLCCNRLYCESCSKKCKKCRKHKADLQYTPDKELYSKIQKLKIKCPNQGRGCDWSDTVFNLKNHLPTCGGQTSTAESKGTSASSQVITEKEKSKTTESHPKIAAADHNEDGSSTTVRRETTGPITTCGEVGQLSTLEDAPVIGNISCPPLNMVMKQVSEYKASAGKIWFSPTFLSHQIGYKLRLAVKMVPQTSNTSLHLEVAIVSAPGPQEHYLKFPCIGDASMHILNPQQNKEHMFISIGFMINNEFNDYNEYCFASIPKEYVYKDCLFFCVEEVCLGDNYKTWLLGPDQEAEDSDTSEQADSNSSEQSDSDSSEQSDSADSI